MRKNNLAVKIDEDESVDTCESSDLNDPEETILGEVSSFVEDGEEESLSLSDFNPTLEAMRDLKTKIDLSFNMQDAIELELCKTNSDLQAEQEKNKVLETEVVRIKVALERKDEDQNQIRDELSLLEEEKLIGDEKNEELLEKIEENEQVIAGFAGFQGQMEQKEREKEKLALENDNLKQELVSSENYIVKLEMEISKIRESREKDQTQIKRLVHEISSLKSTKEVFSEIQKALTDTNASVKARLYKSREQKVLLHGNQKITKQLSHLKTSRGEVGKIRVRS